MRKFFLSAIATIIGTSLVGCSETLHTKQAQTPTPTVDTSSQAQAQQGQLVAIALEQGKTNVLPFVQLLGQPQSEKIIKEDLVQVAWITNRLLTGKQGETPVIVILPVNDPRLEKLPQRGLILQAKKVKDIWVVDALQLGPINQEVTPKAKDTKTKTEK